ncbi:long-chain fatty acid transport protein 4 [Aplysia californica]|uniref:Long-chain-fatty-acid--CoA ligase n=1 Tax=Aplysia californica TaxID=6500 RepID=A0ABM0ZWX2_APLCA|nr:long-chain fatty acid transport protein 4 [Aplysia californica]
MRIRFQSAEFRLARGLRSAVDFGYTVLVYYIGYRMLAKLSLFIALGSVFYTFFNMGLWMTLGALFAVYLATGGWKFMRIVVLTLPRDLRGLRNLVTVLRLTNKYQKGKITVSQIFDETAEKYPKKPCVLFHDEVWTFEEIQKYSNKVANFIYNAGYKEGDVVAIFSENCPQYFPLWVGMGKVGVVSALVNFNLRDVSLAHCIKISKAKAVVFAGNLAQALKDVHPSLPSDVTYYCLGTSDVNSFAYSSFDKELEKSSSFPPPLVVREPKDALFYVYTSGTTGMPKAAVVSHLRFCLMGWGIKLFFSLSNKDVLYIALPLYHTAGGILGVSQAILGGTTLAIRPKFSASQFWTDCVKYKCTAGQYIGEICRYLLAQPFRPEEKQHSVRVLYGNGIKPQIWKSFQDRFGVPLIGEFYGATEGNCSIVNFENKVGAVGFTTRIAPSLYPITLVKVDPATNEIVRDSNGICVKAEPGEPGEMVGKIIKGNPTRDFDGYVDGSATQKKVISDVFKKGDKAFSTGDILVMDDLGYMYFRDRTGDTFRWRGENVSTNEVEAVISNAIQLNDAVVYGVEVPGSEGRAGMAAIVDENDSIDVAQLGQALSRSLPAYARPLFLRFLKEVDRTGTFKLKKTVLRDEGFNITAIQDRMYFLSPKSRQYEPLTKEAYSDILEGRIRL